MRISRAFTLTAATAAAALTLSAVPAQAASLSPTTVADAYSVMLTPTQAKLVGIGKQRVSNFGVANSTKGAPDAPWLCELSGDTAIEGKGAQDVLSSQVLSLGGKNVNTIEQEIHWFANEKQAKKAYDGIVAKVKGCEGQHTPAPNSGDDTSFTITTKLTNGEKKAKDGDAFLWVNSETTMGDPTTNFAEHEYTTVRLFGKYIQIMDLESEGNNAPALTKMQITATDRLTDSLGDAWQAKFM
ncbi:MAG: hypothetical protein NWR45_01205 [Candidatus Nanopelagicales bacterium]|nr:hypothetical protein [Candidatus Nanopelagicales bacterium]